MMYESSRIKVINDEWQVKKLLLGSTVNEQHKPFIRNHSFISVKSGGRVLFLSKMPEADKAPVIYCGWLWLIFMG